LPASNGSPEPWPRPAKDRLELAEPLQQVDRTCVLWRGRKLIYFAGCDYFRLSSHPAVVRAVHDGLDHFGLNVAASRKTTGNHPLYGQLENRLADFFDVESAVLVSNGYMTNLAVAQALAGGFTHALIDERSHGCLFDAATLLGCPVLPFRHRDANSALAAARRLRGRSRLLLLTDGLFSHSGEAAPLNDYLRLLPATTTLQVDDAHSAGILGEHGRGTAEHLGVPTGRIIRTITLSKAFGVYGGAVLGSRDVRNRIISRSRLFVGNTPLPLPLTAAALIAVDLVRAGAELRRRLVSNTDYVKTALRQAGLVIHDGPGPIIALIPRHHRTAATLRKRLLAAGIYPPWINYLGGPGNSYFRFVISSEHTPEQLQTLIGVLRHARP
jgi:7-keto-8-aminopelargonate synthetase-like enzyme